MDSTAEGYDLKGITVLVAEDEQYNFIYLRELLSEFNVNIIRAANGLQAINLCKMYPEIDVVLMDIRMPVMDGYESTKKIKEIRPELPVIAQTAYAMESDRKRALVEGCDDYIAKPIRKNILVKKIYTIVRGEGKEGKGS